VKRRRGKETLLKQKIRTDREPKQAMEARREKRRGR
jgi:hypothetical protein